MEGIWNSSSLLEEGQSELTVLDFIRRNKFMSCEQLYILEFVFQNSFTITAKWKNACISQLPDYIKLYFVSSTRDTRHELIKFFCV